MPKLTAASGLAFSFFIRRSSSKRRSSGSTIPTGSARKTRPKRFPSRARSAAERGLTGALTALDAELQASVAGNPELPVLFSHPVYQYLAHRYGLSARSVHWEPDQMPQHRAKKMVGRSKVRKALVGTFERLLAGLE